jgi:hypothetical protein
MKIKGKPNSKNDKAKALAEGLRLDTSSEPQIEQTTVLQGELVSKIDKRYYYE